MLGHWVLNETTVGCAKTVKPLPPRFFNPQRVYTWNTRFLYAMG